MSGPFAVITPIRAMLFLTPRRRSRPRIADSQIKSLGIAPSRGAIESADRSLHNYFEQFTCLCADGFALMPTPSILVATWDNGLFSVTGKMVHQELADQSIRSLVADGRGRVLAIVGGHFDPLMTNGLR
jgi:hypothetical protein